MEDGQLIQVGFDYEGERYLVKRCLHGRLGYKNKKDQGTTRYWDAEPAVYDTKLPKGFRDKLKRVIKRFKENK